MTPRKGIDTSHYQHRDGAPIDWGKVRAAGIDWAAIKITEGVTFVDPYGEADCMAAMAAGIEVVPYCFARPLSSGPQAEAQFFVEHIPMAAQSCKRMLDLEDGRQLGWQALTEWAQGFVSAQRCELVYVNGSYRDGLHSTGALLLAGIVLADPSNKHDRTGCDVVQTGQGYVDGIVGLVDLDEVHYPAPSVVLLPAGEVPADAGGATEAENAGWAALVAGLPTLAHESRGGYVSVLQLILSDRGWPVDVSGTFAENTFNAVKSYQAEHGLESDGIVGPATWAELIGAQ